MLVTWQTRSLATIIAATVPMEAGKSNPLLEVAMELSLEADLSEAEEPAADNRDGSYEQLVSGFGS